MRVATSGGTTTTTFRLHRPAAGDPLIDAFHSGIYWDEFADQQEPVSAWHRALRGGPYEFTIELALDDDGIVGGICYERYPRSGCGLLTYLVVASRARRLGLGKQLHVGAAQALYDRGAPMVFCEANDPDVTTHESPLIARARIERFVRWGGRVLDVRYIQPSLGPGLARDRQLRLLAIAGDQPLPAELPGATVRAFLDEFYSVTEGNPPDPEIVIPDAV